MTRVWALECGQQAEGQHLQLSLHLNRAKIGSMFDHMSTAPAAPVRLHIALLGCAALLHSIAPSSRCQT